MYGDTNHSGFQFPLILVSLQIKSSTISRSFNYSFNKYQFVLLVKLWYFSENDEIVSASSYDKMPVWDLMEKSSSSHKYLRSNFSILISYIKLWHDLTYISWQVPIIWFQLISFLSILLEIFLDLDWKGSWWRLSLHIFSNLLAVAPKLWIKFLLEEIIF